MENGDFWLWCCSSFWTLKRHTKKIFRMLVQSVISACSQEQIHSYVREFFKSVFPCFLSCFFCYPVPSPTFYYMPIFSCLAVPSFSCLSVLLFLLAKAICRFAQHRLGIYLCTSRSSTCRQIKARHIVLVPEKKSETKVTCTTDQLLIYQTWNKCRMLWVTIVKALLLITLTMHLYDSHVLVNHELPRTLHSTLKELHWSPLIILYKHACLSKILGIYTLYLYTMPHRYIYM